MLSAFFPIIFASFLIPFVLAINWFGYRFISRNGLLQLIFVLAIGAFAAAFFLTEPFAFTYQFALVILHVLFVGSPVIIFAHTVALVVQHRAARLKALVENTRKDLSDV